MTAPSLIASACVATAINGLDWKKTWGSLEKLCLSLEEITNISSVCKKLFIILTKLSIFPL